MVRTIITRRDLLPAVPSAQAALAANNGQSTVDGYREKLLKYIPAEVIALYVSLDAIIRGAASAGKPDMTAYWLLFVFCVVVTPLYLWRASKVEKKLQLLLSTIAFAVWVFALGGPFANLEWVTAHKVLAAMVLPLYTFTVGLIDP